MIGTRVLETTVPEPEMVLSELPTVEDLLDWADSDAGESKKRFSAQTYSIYVHYYESW